MVDSHRPRRRGAQLPPSVMEAARSLVREFGVDRLSELTGTPAGTLYNKISDSADNNNKPTLAEGVLWSTLAAAQGVPNPYRIIHALARACGGVFCLLDDLAHVSDAALLDLLLSRDREQGEFAMAMTQALEDGRISGTDFLKLRKEGLDVVTAWIEILNRLEGMIHE